MLSCLNSKNFFEQSADKVRLPWQQFCEKDSFFQSRSRGEIKSRTNIELVFFVEEKLPDRTHLSERGQPEKKGGGGDQKKVLSGNEMDVQGGDYDFLFKVNCAHNYRGDNIEDFVHIRAKKALRYYLLKVVNISMLVFPALVLHIPTFRWCLWESQGWASLHSFNNLHRWPYISGKSSFHEKEW